MVQIGDVIISSEVLEKMFVCDVEKCHGACCIIGDSGAPLEAEEVAILKSEYPHIREFLRPEGNETIEKLGTSVIDSDGDFVTPLIENRECAYVVFDGEIARCGIEMAWKAGKTDFRKPISCHLYPVRLTKYHSFIAANYHRADFCAPARALGEKLQLRVYAFLKEALIRRFGENFYRELEEAAEESAE